MSTERRPREGIAPEPEEQDPLVIALSGILVKCCDELGVPGCDNCPVRAKCRRLWKQEVNAAGGLNLTDYRRLNQKFAQLKQERDCIMARRGERVPQVLT